MYRRGQAAADAGQRSKEGIATGGFSVASAAQYPYLIRAELCRRSFFFFVQEFWNTVCREVPQWSWHIELFCEELQTLLGYVVRREPKPYDLIFNVPPGTTKSTIITIMFPCFAWLHDPTLRFISASYSAALSLEHADFSREIIRSDKFRLYFPEIMLRQDKDVKSNYANTAGGSRFSTSVGGTLTGSHGHILLIDDPMNPKQALSDVERTAINNWMDHTLPTRKVDKKITPMVLIMQRLHLKDCTGHILSKKKENVRHICLPAEESDLISPPELRERYRDGLLDPARLSRGVLREMYKDLGSYDYNAQVSQSPVNREGAFFEPEKFVLSGALPPRRRIINSVRYWDKAGTEGGGKRTSGCLMHELDDKSFFIADVVKGQWGAARREGVIRQMAELDGVRVRVVTEQEPGSGGKESAENTIKMLQGYVCEADKVTGAKEVRAEPYAAQLSVGNVALYSAGSWAQDFIEEHRTYPNGNFKDMVDSAAGAFNHLALHKKRAGTW